MKIGLFGGSFDPAHNEHTELAKAAVNQLKLDKLIIIPTYISPFKCNITPTPEELRLKMLFLATEGLDKVEVSDYEIKNEGVSYTYLTVKHFAEQYKGAELYFIIGADLIGGFTNWKNPEAILEKATLCVARRHGYDYKKEIYDIETAFSKKIVKIAYEGERVSSTKIRLASALGLDITDSVDKKVAEFIKENGLYLGSEAVGRVRERLPEGKRRHTFGVAITAIDGAERIGVSKYKAEIAGLLHDIAKGITTPFCKELEGVPTAVLHAFNGAYELKRDFSDVLSEDVINAVKYHTTGRPHMTDLEKLIFTADFIEPYRTFSDELPRLRQLFKTDFYKCFTECMRLNYEYLLADGKDIYPLGTEAYEYYVKNK